MRQFWKITRGFHARKQIHVSLPDEQWKDACRHTWTTRAAESGEVDVAALAALLGHSKLNMVIRYAHPQEKHQVDAIKRLERVNAARQIAAFEKKKHTPESPA